MEFCGEEADRFIIRRSDGSAVVRAVESKKTSRVLIRGDEMGNCGLEQ